MDSKFAKDLNKKMIMKTGKKVIMKTKRGKKVIMKMSSENGNLPVESINPSATFAFY